MKRLVVGMGKLNSQRAPYKLLRPLGKTTVLDHALALLGSIDADAKWYYTRDEAVAERARWHGLRVIGRSQASTTGGTFYEVWRELAELAKSEGFSIVTWINSCCPFVNVDRLYSLTRQVSDKLILPVTCVEQPYWSEDGKAIADRPELNTQKAPKLLSLCHSWWVRTPAMMLATAHPGEYVAQHRQARLEKVTDYEALDIDDEDSYRIVNAVFSSLFDIR